MEIMLPRLVIGPHMVKRDSSGYGYTVLLVENDEVTEEFDNYVAGVNHCKKKFEDWFTVVNLMGHKV